MIFAQPLLQNLVRKINFKNKKIANYNFSRFPNGEISIELLNNVYDKNCLVFGTIAPPDQNFLELLLLIHTLKKEKAKSTTLFLPYFAYMRQDKDESNKSLTADFFAKLFQQLGVAQIITFDVHSLKATDFFKIPFISLSPSKIFKEEILKNSWNNNDTILVAPDKGAFARCQLLNETLNNQNPIVRFIKKRLKSKIVSTLHGKVKKRAIVIDDILDTGKTLISCTKALKKAGVQEIIIMVTHGLFTGNLWSELFNLNVKKIYITDTVLFNIPKKYQKKISILSAVPLVQDFLQHQND